MKADRKTPTRRSSAKAPLRQTAVVVATVVINGALVLFLATWAPSSGQADPPTWSVPLEVIDLADDKMEIVEDVSPEIISPIARPVEPELATPPAPAMPTVSLEIETPSQAGLDAIPIPDVPPQLPAFIAQPSAPGPIRAVPSPTPRPNVAPSSGPMLIQPPDLSSYYPRRALRRGVTGKTVVRLAVNAAGRVTDVEIRSSTPEGVFEMAARRVAQTLRFRPALRNDRPVPASVSLNLFWKVED